MDSEKTSFLAEAGIQTIINLLKTLDSLFQGNDENVLSVIFYDPFNTNPYRIKEELR
jgi:hypothetical protein